MNAYLTFPACHRRGGVERVVVEVANFLAQHGHTTTVVSREIDVASLDPSVQSLVLATKSISRFRAIRAYRAAAKRYIDSKPGDKVQAGFGVVSPPDAVLWVQSVHAEWMKIARTHRNWRGRLKQRLNPFHSFALGLERSYFGARQYRKLIALTPRIRDELIEHYQVPEADIEILPNGYSDQEFNPVRRKTLRQAVRDELGYGKSDRVLLFVANELERKGFFPLISALASLKDADIHLLVVGRVSLEPHAPLLKKLGIARQVRHVGASADVGRYYAVADLFVLPTYYEAWGLVIVEALAMGLRVLTSRLAGAAVTVQENVTGLLLDDPHDPAEIATKLTRLLQSTAPSPEAISNTVLNYRWNTVLLQYEQILQRHCR